MGKIKKSATSRHESTLSPMIADFVKATASIPLYQLPAHLASFPRQWPFPRGDTYHWIPVLNRFDRILEMFNEEYGLTRGPQTQPFQRQLLLMGDAEAGKATPDTIATDAILDGLNIPQDGDRHLVEQILNFTRLLLESCGNRSLYNSSGHLNDLLNTTSLSLLNTTLRLGVRLAQRYYAARQRLAPAAGIVPSLLAGHYNINLEKVQKLASPFPKGPSSSPGIAFNTPTGKGKDKAFSERRPASEKCNPADLVNLLKDGVPPAVLKEEFGGVSISYYEPPTGSSEGEKNAPGTLATPGTPTPVRRTSNLGPSQTPRQNRTASSADDSPTTPVTPFSRDQESSQTGPKIFEISADEVSETDAHELIKKGLEGLPESVHYELLHKVRVAQSLSGDLSHRKDIVGVRLLAIANLGYVHAEKEFYQKLGQQDSDEPRRLQLAYQLSELVQPPGAGEKGVSRELQTFALSALDSLTKHKTKSSDVCAALNVNVNHGVLFYVVRKAVAELGMENDSDDNVDEDEWREALFSLLNSLPTAQPRTGEGMVTAGLLQILVEVLTLRTSKAERNHPRVLNFLDTFVYNLRDAFQALVAAKGLNIIADLTAYEVETSKQRAEDGKGMPTEYKTQLTDYKIPFYQQQTLRWLFKFMNHMMSHNGGNNDRLLRNLIDSPQLLGGLRIVLSNASIFGSTVWSMAVNILTNFIHNEPTSYQVIAEAGLSRAFLETVTQQSILEPKDPPQSTESSSAGPPAGASPASSPGPQRRPVVYPPRETPLAQGILPVAEAISTLPPAYGAICLAESGMKLFKSSAALASFFEIFESPAHIKAMDADPDMPTMIGNSFDELVRHHPALKSEVLASLSEMISRVVQLCSEKAEQEGVGAKLWIEDGQGRILVSGGREALTGPNGPVQMRITQHDNAESDVEMRDVGDSTPAIVSNNDVTIDQVVENEDSTVGPTTTQYISVVCKFLSGFFVNNMLSAAFIESDGIETVLDFITLPCLPYKFNEPHSTSEEISRLVQLLVEQKPHIVVPSLLKRCQRAVDRLEPLMNYTGPVAFFAPFTTPGSSEAVDSLQTEITKHGTEYAKSLVNVHTLCNALTFTFQSQMFNHRANHNVFSQVNLADMYARMVSSLGRLHRSCVWEEILLQKSIPSDWEKETRITGSGFGTEEADDILRISHNEPTPSEGNEGSGSGINTQDSNTETTNIVSALKPGRVEDSVQLKNSRTLRYLLSKVPGAIAPFFQSLGKLLLFRRSPEAYQKQCASIVADQLAKAALDQLQFEIPTKSERPEDKYAYWIIILTSMSQLMIDNGLERGYPQALTLVLNSFKNQEGFKVLSGILTSFYDSATSIIETQGEEKAKDDRLLNLSLGGIKIILGFYAQIISSKLINEASQTTSMHSSRDRDRERGDYFLPSQFLVELRYAIIEPVRKIWKSDLINKATTSIVKTSISILRTVMDGDSEHGANKLSDKVPKRQKMSIRPWKPRTGEHISRLTQQDFPEDLATEALYRCCDNYNSAREYCLNQTQDPRSTRNPVPSYENVKLPTSSLPSRAAPPQTAEVVEAAAETEESGATGHAADSEASDSQSVEMEDATEEAESSAEANHNTRTPTPEVAPVEPITDSWDGPSYVIALRHGTVRAVEHVSIDDLDNERTKLRDDLIERSLEILNSHDDVTFELSDLITAAVSRASEPATMRASIGQAILLSLVSLQSENDFRENGKRIASMAHLLALIIQEDEFYSAIVDDLKVHFSVLLDFVKIFPDQSPDESSPWVGQILLILERLLAEDHLPNQISWTPPSADNPQEDASEEQIPEPVVPLDNKFQLLDAIMKVLPRIGKDESLALSVTRVLVMLTRTRKIAQRVGEKSNIQRLFLMVRQLAGVTNEGLRSAFMLVLRHIIEDDTIIRQIMRADIQSMFENRNQRQTDTTAYTRQMFYLALRAPEIFVEVTNEKLQLARFDQGQRQQSLALKREDFSTPQSAAEPSEEVSMDKADGTNKGKGPSEPKKAFALERTKTSDLKPPVVENPDGVIHYLLCELLAYKDVEDQPAASKSEGAKDTDKASSSQDSDPSSPVSSSVQNKSDKLEFKAESHPIYIYRCFILKCLAELLHSYNRAKIEFINFSRKADPHATTPSKPRSGVLNYLLNALVPVGTLNHEGDLSFKKKYATSSCATDVIVSLCVKTGENGFPKTGLGQPSPYIETEPDLLFVRKFVLEHALKAFKDASASDEPLDMKYSRLLNLSDIFSKMVSQRSDGTILSPTSELLPHLKQMAKVMYEKNFITVLTSAIADIDLNFPNAKRAVKYILKPLKWLCAVAVDLSTQFDIGSTPEIIDEDEISTASDDDVAGATREETPDLFRNSTLGMFEPGQESESESGSEDDDEEMYDDQYADDMEYDEMEPPDDDVVSDEDADIGEMGPIEGIPGDIPMDVEIVVDDDGEDVLSPDDESEESDESEDDDDDDEDMDDMEEIEGMEEVSGDDENASLADGDDNGWSDEEGPYPSEDAGADIHPNNAGLTQLLDVLENHGNMLDDINDELEQGGMEGLEEDFLVDREVEDDEDDDDEDDEFDEEDIVFNAGDDEDGMHGWGWDDVGGHGRHTHRINPWMFPGGPNDRIMVPHFRSHRPGGGARAADDGLNPLLHRAGRSTAGPPGRNEGMSDWVHAIEGRGPRVFNAESPVTFINNLLNAMSQGTGPTIHQHGGALHLSFNSFPGLPPPFDPAIRRNLGQARESAQMSRSTREDPQSAVTFMKAFTITRWQEEARILYGSAATEKSSRVINAILKLMVPPAIEAAKKRQAEREAEASRKALEEAERKAQKEREEREAKEKEEREQREREAAEAEANAARAVEGNTESPPEGESGAPPEGQAMEGVESSEPHTEQNAEAGPSEAQPRVVTNIRGRELDITGLGIDLEYLEALPEEYREEVLMQQLAQQREQQPTTEEPSGIEREFLDALPPEIREELLQQEAQERRRREREEARRRNQANGQTARAEDMDTASFLASLEPGLRQAVLMDQGEDVLAQLPPEIAVEARALGGDRRLNQFHDFLPQGFRRGGADRRNPPDDPSQKKKSRPCVQILDKAGVATLLRLMFIPQTGSAKISFGHILKNVCENRQNRAEVISILLSILQDGSADINAVERSFAQLSLRAKQPHAANDKTPKFSKRTAGGHFATNPEISPLLVVQQCLQTLCSLTEKNPAVPSFFLTEHETAVGFKSRAKGKGKSKETKATKFPLNALLSLLERRLVIESSSIMEQLTTLLKIITNPLQKLRKEKEEAMEEAKKQEAGSSNQAQTSNEQTDPSGQPADRAEDAEPTEDTEMTTMSRTTTQEVAQVETKESTSASAPETAEAQDKAKKHKSLSPPEVPEVNLRLVARILAARECNSKVFQETLSVISNLSPIPGAKEVFGKELVGIAQNLGENILRELAELTVQVSKADSPTDVQGMALSKFSPPSSDQAKLLRALTALDYLFDPSRDNKDKDKSAEPLEPSQKEDILNRLYDNSTFAPLWDKLSECLTVIRKRGNMLNIATILLPLIEALMVVCKNTQLDDGSSKPLSRSAVLSSPVPESKMENLFFKFTEEHRKILNELVRQNAKLMTGNFSLLVKNSKVLEFDNKRNYFNRRLHARPTDRERHSQPPLQLNIRRDNVFSDSYKNMYYKTADEMKYGKLNIRFVGEEGVDAGGVTREWFQVLSREMFNPDYALFAPVPADRTTFHINRNSYFNEEHLLYFKFIGRIIGKALYENRVLDCHFSRAIYKRMLNKAVNLKDMENLDLEYYNSQQWMLNNDITDILSLTFSIEDDVFGETKVIDLKPNGRNIPVTEENKHEYVQLICEHRLTGSIDSQLQDFLRGFHDIVPADLVSIFSEQELELLISGLPDINIDDWKNNTEYHNYTAASPQIQWFWRAVRSFDKEEQAKLLQFVTGTSKVPLNGFKELEGMNGFSRFNIHRDYGSKDRLPSSHTCFNQLDLPEYETYDVLRQQLYTAITAGSEYFGFA